MALPSQPEIPTTLYGDMPNVPQPMPGLQRGMDNVATGLEQMLPMAVSPRMQAPPGFSGASTPQGANMSKSLPILGQQPSMEAPRGSSGSLKRPVTISEKPGAALGSVEPGRTDGGAFIFRAKPDVKPGMMSQMSPAAFRKPLIPQGDTHEATPAGAAGRPGYVSLSVTPAQNSQGSYQAMPNTVNDGIIAQLLVQIQQLQEKVDQLTRLPSTQRINIGTPVKTGDSDDEEEIDDLKDINFKDIEKPTKYDGKGWNTWSRNFKSFLERRDLRWAKVLEAIADKKRVLRH